MQLHNILKLNNFKLRFPHDILYFLKIPEIYLRVHVELSVKMDGDRYGFRECEPTDSSITDISLVTSRQAEFGKVMTLYHMCPE